MKADGQVGNLGGPSTIYVTDPAKISDLMDFEHVIVVDNNGATDYDGQDPRFPNIYAPEVYGDEFSDPDWEPVTGYSNQYSYSGPLMHPSEFIGRGMGASILDEPGVYVTVVVECDGSECDPDVHDEGGCDADGWMLLRHKRYGDVSPEVAELIGPDAYDLEGQYEKLTELRDSILVDARTNEDRAMRQEAYYHVVDNTARMFARYNLDCDSRLLAARAAITDPAVVQKQAEVAAGKETLRAIRMAGSDDEARDIALRHGLLHPSAVAGMSKNEIVDRAEASLASSRDPESYREALASIIDPVERPGSPRKGDRAAFLSGYQPVWASVSDEDHSSLSEAVRALPIDVFVRLTEDH
jgi:hypothetical protein